MRNTIKNKDINDFFLSKNITQNIIVCEIYKFLDADDKYTLYGNSFMDFYPPSYFTGFTPELIYGFQYDEESHNDDGCYSPYTYPPYQLTNTDFNNKTKRYIEKRIWYYAVKYQLYNYNRIINMIPKIYITSTLIIGNLDKTRARPPRTDEKLVISFKRKNHNHRATIWIEFENFEKKIKLYAHEAG